MSMISPKMFAEQYKDMSYDELLPVRDDLIQDIWKFEKSEDSGGDILPSPQTIYQVYLEYLGKLCELIADKYRDMQWQ